MWVLHYHYHFGDDLALFAAERDCRKEALNLVREYRDKWEIDERVTDRQALEDWGRHTGWEESIDVSEYFVRGASKKGNAPRS